MARRDRRVSAVITPLRAASSTDRPRRTNRSSEPSPTAKKRSCDTPRAPSTASRRRARELLEHDLADQGWRFDTIPFLWSIGVDTALKTGELEIADQLVERLTREAPARRPPHLAAELLRTRARLAVARGQQADVEGLLRESIERLEQIPRPVPAGHARLDLRDWLAAHGRHDEASQIAEPAVATARHLGAIALVERLDVSTVPTPTAGTTSTSPS